MPRPKEMIGPGIPSFPLARGFMMALLVFSLVPIVWLVLTSVKNETAIFSIPPRIFIWPDFSNYWKFLGTGNESALRLIGNSVYVAMVTTVLTLLFSSFAAYAFSRYRFKWDRHLMFLMLATRLLPPITAVVPLYLVFRYLGLLDTRFVLILIYTALNVPFATWLMKAFFDGVPKELEEAAALDGCGTLRTLWKVVVPLSASGFAATSIFVFFSPGMSLCSPTCSRIRSPEPCRFACRSLSARCRSSGRNWRRWRLYSFCRPLRWVFSCSGTSSAR